MQRATTRTHIHTLCYARTTGSINAMNEVWVPSEWQRGTFAASGVEPSKIRVVPEGVNTTLFDPARCAGRSRRQVNARLPCRSN